MFTTLPKCVASFFSTDGASVTGGLELAFDLVAGGVMWFDNVGSTPVVVTARVT